MGGGFSHRAPSAHTLFTTLLPDGIAISVITFSEIYEGIYTSRAPRQAEHAFQAFLTQARVLGVTRMVAKRNAQIRGDLRRLKHPVTHRSFDLLIAATALTHDLTLVSRNLRDYSDVPGLNTYPPS